MKTPLQQFLENCYAEIHPDNSGHVADYIPELSKGDPNKFALSVATLDGHVYDAGDCQTLFTIQSISKAFVFALALETLGSERVESVISVEPSGEAFNSIRLTADNKPFNPMVNAGAIACSGLIVANEGVNAFDRIRQTLCRFAGRELDIDESVYRSESLTGDRNRAIAWLLRNYARLPADVDSVVDAYFRQCSILVNAHDLAIMAATLANSGVNPVTGDRIISDYVAARTLSVMTSSGMYDYAGQWIYRVGIPAKSGVGGGIIASLPAVMGLGTFSPKLDSYGNSVRGILACERISSYFNLHVLSRKDDVKTCVLADYSIKGISSRRVRRASEAVTLQDHHDEVRIIELVGSLAFSSIDYVSRLVIEKADNLKYIIIDLKRVPSITRAGAILLNQLGRNFQSHGVKFILSGLNTETQRVIDEKNTVAEKSFSAEYQLLDDAIEWVEHEIIMSHSEQCPQTEFIPLGEQFLLSGFTAEELSAFESLCVERVYRGGEKIFSYGEAADSLFFLQSGAVSIKLPNGVVLSALSAGMSFGELALVENTRSADIWADADVKCRELKLDAYALFCKSNDGCGERFLLNAAKLLTQRLRLANAKVNNLTSSR
jgi:glutaminase